MDLGQLQFDEKRFDPGGCAGLLYQGGADGRLYEPREPRDHPARGKDLLLVAFARRAVAQGRDKRNYQRVVSIKADCDADALVVEVIKDGPACHTGAESCFFHAIFEDETVARFSLEALYELLVGRNEQRPEGATTYLLRRARRKFSKKWARSARRSSSAR